MENILRQASQIFNKSNRPPQPSRDIPRNILAFRTITKLLSLIQQERAFQALQPRSADNRRLELKLTNALATVAVINHEVVAVVNNLDSDKLDLIVSVESSRIPPSESPAPNLLHVLFPQNYRFSDPKPNSTGQPTISSAEALADIKLVGNKTIQQYAEECW
jgi:hypothetical protein